MAEEIVYKKFYRKADQHLNGTVEAKHGKQANQKLKPYMVLQHLLKTTDENNVQSVYDIIAALQEWGLTAERRSVYRDIEEINKAALVIDEDCTIEEAEEMLANDEYDEEKLIVYSPSKKGFYARPRFLLEDIRLLAECIYSAKFIEEEQAQLLVDVVCQFVSEHQAKKIRHDALLTDRVKTNNKDVLNNIAEINDAMSRELKGEKHTPEKISFKYLKYSVGDMSNQVERRHGAKYVVSPYKLLIYDGNYYLLAFDDKTQKMMTYRVDRMKGVSATGEPREGSEEFAKIDLKTYTKRVFSMYKGEEKMVTIRFSNHLLDAVVDRFGTKGITYSKTDDRHFSITAQIEISDQFFGWVLGFGRAAKILAPIDVTEKFRGYLDKIREMY